MSVRRFFSEMGLGLMSDQRKSRRGTMGKRAIARAIEDSRRMCTVETMEGRVLLSGVAITSDLVITPDVQQGYLDSIESVSGSVIVQGDRSDLTLPNLQSVGGGFYVDGVTLSSVDAPRLLSVGGTISLTNDPTLVSCDFTALSSVGMFYMANNGSGIPTGAAAGQALSLGQLQNASGAIWIYDNPFVTGISLASPNQLGGSFVFNGNGAGVPVGAAAGQVLSLGQLQSMSGGIAVSGNPFVTGISLASLTQVGSIWGYSLQFRSNGSGLPAGAAAGQVLSLGQLQNAPEAIAVWDNRFVTGISLASLTQTSYFGFSGNGAGVPVGAAAGQLLALGQLQNVSGGISVSGNPFITGISLASLTQVGGDFWFENNGSGVPTGAAAGQVLLADQLQSVAGPLFVADNPFVTGISVASLTQVGGYFMFYRNGSGVPVGTAAAQVLSLDQLQNVAGGIGVNDNPFVTGISLASLNQVGDLWGYSFVFRDNGSGVPAGAAAGQVLSLDQLQNTSGAITVYGNPFVTGISLASLTQLGGTFVFNGNGSGVPAGAAAGQVLSLDQLQNAPWDISVSGNPFVTGMSLASLNQVGGYLWFENNGSGVPTGAAAGQVLLADQLQSVSGPIFVGGNPFVTGISLASLAQVGGYFVFNSNGSGVPVGAAAAQVLGLGQLESASAGISVYNNPFVTGISLASLTQLGGDFWFRSNGSGLPAGTAAGQVLSLDQLQNASGGILVWSNSFVTGISLASLTQLDGWFSFSGNGSGVAVGGAAAQLLSLDHIQSAPLGISVGGNPFVTGISLASLTQLGGEFNFSGNGSGVPVGAVAGQVLSLDQLENVSGAITVYDNPYVTGISLASLTQLGGSFDFQSNGFGLPAAAAAGQMLLLGQLQDVSGRIWVYNNWFVTGISLGSLTQLAGDFVFNTNGSALPAGAQVVGGVRLGGLQEVGGALQIMYNPLLASISVPDLTHVGGDFMVRDNGTRASGDTTTSVSGALATYGDNDVVLAAQVTASGFQILQLTSLLEVDGNLTIYNDPFLSGVRLNDLMRVGGTQFIDIPVLAGAPSTEPVNEGMVTFTVFDASGAIVGSVSSQGVANGAATALFPLASVSAGTYTIQAAYHDDAAKPQFNDSATTAQTAGTLTINKAQLRISANDITKTYGQTVTFAGTEFSVTGLVNSDSVASVTLTSAGAAATATVADSPYDILASDAVGTGVGNYDITYSVGKLTVDKAALGGFAATQDALNIAKQGSVTIDLSSITGLVNGDTVASVFGNATYVLVIGESTYTFDPTVAIDSVQNIVYVTYTLRGRTAAGDALRADLLAVDNGATSASKASYSAIWIIASSANYTFADDFLTRLFCSAK